MDEFCIDKWSKSYSRRCQRYLPSTTADVGFALSMDWDICTIGELVQAYLDEHRSEFSTEDVKWIEDCRDSAVL